MGKTKIVRQLRNGQITIPKEFRDELGLEPDDLLRVELSGGRLEMTAVKASPRRGSEWLSKIREDLAPFRESIAGKTDEEITRAIEETLEEVRRPKRNSA